MSLIHSVRLETALMRARITALVLIALGVAVASRPVVAAPCSTYNGPHINGSRWCLPSSTTIKVYRGSGLNPCGTNGNCLAWKAQIELGVEAWNTALAGQLSSNVTLEALPDNVDNCTDCIVFRLGPFGFPDLARTTWSGPIASGWRNTQSAVVRIDNDVAFTSTMRNTVVLHEIGHALGLGHDCTGLMFETSTDQSIDGRSIDVLKCIYGSPDCSDPLTCTCNHFGIDVDLVGASTARLLVSTCGCLPCGGPVPVTPGGGTATGVTFKLAISEQGGPYQEFETLTEADLAPDGTYTYAFGSSYASALIRLQAFSGAALLDEAYTTFPISLAGTTDAGPTPGPTGIDLRVWPNPFSKGAAISFTSPVAGHAVVHVCDVAGRFVATLYDGTITSGRHDLTWDGRSDSGGSPAPGVYRCVASIEGATHATAILKLH